jgi:hypothetical protein
LRANRINNRTNSRPSRTKRTGNAPVSVVDNIPSTIATTSMSNSEERIGRKIRNVRSNFRKQKKHHLANVSLMDLANESARNTKRFLNMRQTNRQI